MRENADESWALISIAHPDPGRSGVFAEVRAEQNIPVQPGISSAHVRPVEAWSGRNGDSRGDKSICHPYGSSRAQERHCATFGRAR